MRIIFLVVFVATLSAAPRLRLLETSVNVSVAPGANGTAQQIDAINAGDSQLHLAASSSVPWLTPSVGHPTLCGLLGCIPIQIGFQTSGLAKGTYTGTVTISDPNAIDAPQFVTVTVAVGGNVPDKLEFFVAPSSAASSSFSAAAKASFAVSNSPWLTVKSTLVNGASQFLVTASGLNGMAPGDYMGTITITGSPFAPDNKTISVLLHVTTQPILQAAPSALQFRIAQGANKQTATVALSNPGGGMLMLSGSGVTATAATGMWLSAQGNIQSITVTADPTGLSPNTYTGTVTIASNAANASVTIPVQLIVEAQIPPTASSAGIIANDTQGGGSLAQGDVVSMFGDQFTYGDAQGAAGLPLTNNLGGVQVFVNKQLAPLYYVSPNQINFEVPIDAGIGDGTVQVIRNGQAGNLAYINIASRAPNFLLLGGGPYAIMTTPTNDLTGIPSHPVKAGDAIVIYTIGLGPTSPVVPSGTASPQGPSLAVVPPVQVCFGQPSPFTLPPCATSFFAGLTPGFVGLYQINVFIPEGVPSGTTPLFFEIGGVASDSVLLAVQ